MRKKLCPLFTANLIEVGILHVQPHYLLQFYFVAGLQWAHLINAKGVESK